MQKLKVNYIKPDTDIYPLLKSFDALITDYSSICIDFMHARKPIFLYWADSGQYFSERRMLNLKTMERINIVPKHNIVDLLDEIHKSLNLFAFPLCEAKNFHDYMDGGSSERTCVAIEELLMR